MAKVSLVHITTVPASLLAFFRGQIDFMRQRGFDVQAVSSPGEALQQFQSREQIPVHGVPMARRITPVQDVVTLLRLARTLRTIRPQIVHAHTPKGGLLGMLAAWLVGVPVRVYSLRGLPLMTAGGAKRRLLRLTEQIACRCASQVFAVSGSLRDVAVQEGLCPPAKIAVLGNGSGNGVDAAGRFDPAKFGPGRRQEVRERYGIPREAIVLGYVGRIVRDKGMVELAAAWKTLRAACPALHLLLVGEFEPQDPVPADVGELFHNDPRIHVAGHVAETPPRYAAMDLVVLPSYREGFPNVCLEAAAMALPVVSTRVPGCLDAVVDGVTGKLVPAGDAQALAWAIRSYLDDPALRCQHGLAGRGRAVRDFQPERIWEAQYQEYARLLREKHLPGLENGSEDARARQSRVAA